MKKRIILLCAAIAAALALFLGAQHNYRFFYSVPDTEKISADMLALCDYNYEYPSDVLRSESENGFFQYPLAMVGDDDSEYRLVRRGLIPYEIDDTQFLKENRMELVVFQRSGTHSEFHSTFALYKDDVCIDYVVCTTVSESFCGRSSTSEFWFLAKYILHSGD